MLSVTALAYWSGLSGDFLFDDHVNLNALGRYGGVHDLQTLLFYLSSGIADPTGRPVSMASFLLDARDWPADPFPFKRTNLLMHLVNGFLLYNVLASLGHRLSQDSGRVRIAALLAAALWLMNPLWASTVLYVVQRHAILATLFVLLGIRTWIGSRNAFDKGLHIRGWWLAVLAVPVFGTLAGLSKANGFLLPVLLAVLELSVLRSPTSTESSHRWASRLLIWLPALMVLAWLCGQALQIGLDGTQDRPWTLAQRLLTQPRALCDYLWHLWIPGLNATGVFADGFAPSQGLFTPPSTLPAILTIGILAGIAWGSRRRAPVLAAALGLFLAGHAMESSVVMLELYFEHRNYLPAAMLFWPLAWWLSAPGHYRRWLLTGAIAYASLMLLTTTIQARLWADPLALALTWAEQNPNSARAQAHAIHQEVVAGKRHAAEQKLLTLLEQTPLEPQLALSLLNLRCEQQRVTLADIEHAANAIVSSNGLALDMNYQWLSAVLPPDSGAACSSLQDKHLQILINASTLDAGQPDPDDPEMQSRAHRLTGYLALRQQNCTVAQQEFDRRIAVQPRPEFIQSQVALLATQCGPEHALAHLENYLSAGAPVFRASSPMLRLRDLIMQSWWSKHFEELQHTLKGETAQYVRRQHSSATIPFPSGAEDVPPHAIRDTVN